MTPSVFQECSQRWHLAVAIGPRSACLCSFLHTPTDNGQDMHSTCTAHGRESGEDRTCTPHTEQAQERTAHRQTGQGSWLLCVPAQPAQRCFCRRKTPLRPSPAFQEVQPLCALCAITVSVRSASHSSSFYSVSSFGLYVPIQPDYFSIWTAHHQLCFVSPYADGHGAEGHRGGHGVQARLLGAGQDVR